MRVYSSYSADESEALANSARERGLSVSAYQKICVLKALGIKNNTNTIANLVFTMKKNILALPSGTTFVISAVLKDEYYSCSKSEQTVLAKALKQYAVDCPNILKRNSSVKTTTQYIRV